MLFIGVDIESIPRVKKIIEDVNLLESDNVLTSVFTKEEIKYCTSSKRPYKHFTIRFAGKEAFFKALSSGPKSDFLFSDIEFLNNEDGAPIVNCYGKVKQQLFEKKIKKINVSFSHSRDQGIAIVILEDWPWKWIWMPLKIY